MRIGQSGDRRYCTNSWVPGSAHKISTDIRPVLPPFLQGSKMSQISTRVIFKPPYFLTAALYRKTNLSRTDDRSTTTPNMRWVGPPTPITVGQWVPQKVKVENLLYILHSSGPRQVERQQCNQLMGP